MVNAVSLSVTVGSLCVETDKCACAVSDKAGSGDCGVVSLEESLVGE